MYTRETKWKWLKTEAENGKAQDASDTNRVGLFRTEEFC